MKKLDSDNILANVSKKAPVKNQLEPQKIAKAHQKRDKKLQVMLTTSELEMLGELANQKGNSKSGLIRFLIRRELGLTN